MGFRVYDSKERKWVRDKIYMTPDGNLFKIKKSLFGLTSMPVPLDSKRYIYHKDIDLYDKYGFPVSEGDYIKAQINEDTTEIGLVTYATELSSYVILCVDSDNFYTLGSNISKKISIIGNVFDGYAITDGEIKYE